MSVIIKLFKSVFYSIRYTKSFNKIGIFSKVSLKASKNSKFCINGHLCFGANIKENNGRNILFRMDDNSKIIVDGHFNFYYGCDIILFKNATLTLGNSFINSDAKIRCHNSISIGNGCAISHDFTVMDSNAHYLNGDNKTKPVVIKDHVWIGTRVTILSGVTVGEGSVIAAGSVVTKNIPPYTLAGGNPAKIIKENVKWKA